MATLSELQAQRDKLISEMSSPAEIHFGERGVTHRSQGDLEQALQRIDAEIAKTQGSPLGGIFQIVTGRGLA